MACTVLQYVAGKIDGFSQHKKEVGYMSQYVSARRVQRVFNFMHTV